MKTEMMNEKMELNSNELEQINGGCGYGCDCDCNDDCNCDDNCGCDCDCH